jgi:hypothetical protein
MVGISKEQTFVGSNDIPGLINSSTGDLHRGKFTFGSVKPVGELLPFRAMVSCGVNEPFRRHLFR